MLPLSSFPMFGAPQNVFDRKLRKHVWLTTKPHATGTLKNYEPEPQPYLTPTLPNPDPDHSPNPNPDPTTLTLTPILALTLTRHPKELRLPLLPCAHRHRRRARHAHPSTLTPRAQAATPCIRPATPCIRPAARRVRSATACTHPATLRVPGQLPFDYLLLSHGGDAAKALHSNVPLTPRLQAALGRIERLGDQEAHTFATDDAAAPALLDALDEAKAAFSEAGLGQADGVGKAGRGSFDAAPLKGPGTLPASPPASGAPRQRTRQRGPASKDPAPRP